MKAFLWGLVFGVPGYFVGLFVCLGLWPLLSPNSHDGAVEAAMTGALFVGPLLALVGFVMGVRLRRARQRKRESKPPRFADERRFSAANPGSRCAGRGRWY